MDLLGSPAARFWWWTEGQFRLSPVLGIVCLPIFSYLPSFLKLEHGSASVSPMAGTVLSREAEGSRLKCIWACAEVAFPGPHFYVTNDTRGAFLLFAASPELAPLLGAWRTDSRDGACLRKPPSRGRPSRQTRHRLSGHQWAAPPGLPQRQGTQHVERVICGMCRDWTEGASTQFLAFFFFFNTILVISRCF